MASYLLERGKVDRDGHGRYYAGDIIGGRAEEMAQGGDGLDGDGSSLVAASRRG